MRQIRETLRLHLQAGLSYNEVGRALKISKSVVGKYVSLARVAGVVEVEQLHRAGHPDAVGRQALGHPARFQRAQRRQQQKRPRTNRQPRLPLRSLPSKRQPQPQPRRL